MDKITEIEELKALICEGNNFLKLPESDTVFGTSISSGIAIPVTSQMDSWISRGVEYIYSLLPETIIDSDFIEVAKIHEFRVGKSQIITSSYKENISKVIGALDACLRFFEWFLVFDDNELDAQQKVRFHFDSLEAIVLYAQKELVPSLMGMENGITKKTALLHLYGRIFSVAYGIVKLNDSNCCHLLAASLRILLEVYIDMLLIKDGLIANDIKKFFSFFDVFTYRSALSLIRIDEELQKPIKESSNIKVIVRSPEQIEQISDKFWGKKPQKINHWANLHLEERARRSNALEIYRHVYYYGNMYIHSGYLHFPKTEDDAHFLQAHAYSISLEIFNKSTELLCNEIGLAQRKETKKVIDEVCLWHGYFPLWKFLITASRK